jgi:hypothetical protein
VSAIELLPEDGPESPLVHIPTRINYLEAVIALTNLHILPWQVDRWTKSTEYRATYERFVFRLYHPVKRWGSRLPKTTLIIKDSITGQEYRYTMAKSPNAMSALLMVIEDDLDHEFHSSFTKRLISRLNDESGSESGKIEEEEIQP